MTIMFYYSDVRTVLFSECVFSSSSILQAYEEAQKRLKMAEEDQRKIVSLSFRKIC